MFLSTFGLGYYFYTICEMRSKSSVLSFILFSFTFQVIVKKANFSINDTRHFSADNHKLS